MGSAEQGRWGYSTDVHKTGQEESGRLQHE